MMLSLFLLLFYFFIFFLMGKDAATGHEVVRNGRMLVPALPVAQHAIFRVSLGATQLLLSENECTALFSLARCNAISG